MPRELFFKIRLFGKEEALILLLCLHFPTADRFSHSPFCIPTAHIAKKKYTRLEFGLVKTIIILLTEAQPETKKCSIKISALKKVWVFLQIIKTLDRILILLLFSG